MYTIYCFTNRVNGKKYIGCTSKASIHRSGKDGEYYRGSTRFYAAIQEFGWDAFERQILAAGLNKVEAAEAEKKYIEQYQTSDERYGYNRNVGGYVHNDIAPEQEEQRVTKIKNTLHAQRSSKEYRKIMSERMHKVWNDPERSARLRKRNENGGRRPITVTCKETGVTYLNMHIAAKELGLHLSVISALKCKWEVKGEEWVTRSVRTGKFAGTTLHLKYGGR